jgi:hypothetical protein
MTRILRRLRPHGRSTYALGLTVERAIGHPQQTGHAERVVELLTLLAEPPSQNSYRGEAPWSRTQ